MSSPCPLAGLVLYDEEDELEDDADGEGAIGGDTDVELGATVDDELGCTWAKVAVGDEEEEGC